MTVSESVTVFLRTRRPKAFCDDCIADELGKNRRQIQPITVTLKESAEFTRLKGTCVGCLSQTKFAINAN